ncbi:probable serine/threonine-protein kinase PBL5 [Cornus florida]|uniref:probable serine/threonine-protein kinase PBL5 n=1 Tax=Cornus florida TaxID=4283 RepID=UPI00289CB75D|nr:probable serine/threonine-protein kinase PBL5 [Cornus florida]
MAYIINFTQDQMKDFSDYLPADELGEGRFSKVYKGRMAIQGLDPRDIAIKVFKPAISDEHWANLLAQWQAETNWLTRFRHRNIIKLIGYCDNRAERKLYLVYEYMAGGTLKQHQSGLDWPGILKVLRGIASALKYIHTYLPGVVCGDFPGVVYGDLKPENILLGQDGEPKISDFGTVTRVDETLMAFTYGYIAPSAHRSRKYIYF